MSIKAKPWEGGAGATVPDASETTKGKIRIATTTESNAGTDDLTAMTPAKVKARIDAALVGGVEYKGQIAVSAFSTLLNADQGDMYKISTGGTAGDGRTYEAGDTIIVNADMGGTFADSKLDKIDNTEIISSVNGQTGPVNIYADDTVLNIAGTGLSISGSGATSTLNADSATTSAPGIIEIATNTEAQAGSATDKALVPSNLGSIGTSQLNNDAGFITSAGVGNQITDIEIKTGSTFTAEANHLYVCGYTSGTQTITFPDASNSTTGDIIGLSTQSTTRSVSLVSSDGTTNDLLNNTNDTRGGTNGALNLSIHRQVSWFVSDGAQWLETNAALKPVATTGAYSDLSGTPTVPSALNDLSDVTITGAGTGEVLRYSGSAWVDAQLAYSDLSGTPTLATVATTGAYSDLSGTPSLATVATTGAYSDLSGTPTVPTTLNTLTDVSISSVSNGQVISYNSTSGEWENSTPSSGGATDLNGLSDVTITSASSGQILRNNGSGQFVNVALSIVDDPSPQLGGNLDVNGQSITSASGGNVVINPDGAGTINLGADTIPDADATHDLGTESARFAEIHGELEGAVMFKARNETGGSLTKGQAVYISGLSGSTPLISLAQSNSASTMQAFGLLAANVSNNADVKVISFGNLTDIDTSSFSAGDTVFISSTVAGGLVSSAPTGTANLIQNIGKVVRSHASAGIIKVGGAGRTNATPNLNNGQVFAGNASNQAVATALSSIAVTSLNGSAGVVTVSGDDLAADHSASNYTAANANIDGHLSGIDTALGTRLSDVVDDTTPQLGGNLDTNGQDIVTTSNADLDLAPDGTGVVVVRGNQTGGNNQGAIKLNCEQNSHGVAIVSPAHSAGASYNLILPTGVGTSGQVLKTDGGDSSTPKNVQLSWVDQSGGGGGGSAPTVTSASPGTAYTISTHADNEEVYLLTPSADIAVNFPAASAAGSGYRYHIKNLGGSYNLTLTPASGTIDGASTYVTSAQNEAVTCVSDGSNWFII